MGTSVHFRSVRYVNQNHMGSLCPTRSQPTMNESSEQITSEFEIRNSLGLHARPASLFVETVSTFNADVLVEKDGETVNGKSLMGLLMLSAGFGTVVKITAKGEDAKKALDALADLFNRKFDEE